MVVVQESQQEAGLEVRDLKLDPATLICGSGVLAASLSAAQIKDFTQGGQEMLKMDKYLRAKLGEILNMLEEYVKM